MIGEVKRCSISGIAFSLERAAYDELMAYLESLRRHYKGEAEGDEICADIEARIAELILSAQDGSRTVALPLIRNIIDQLGSADQIDPDEKSSQNGAASVGDNTNPRIPRRLYRDAEAGKLGGVCAGLASYFDVDPVWIRLMMFVPLFVQFFLPNVSWLWWLSDLMGNLFWVFVVVYIIMWFVVPSARTARQKLEMRGEKITAQAIGDKTKARGDVDGRSKAAVADTVSTFSKVLTILLKLFAGFVIFLLVLVSCSLIIGIVAVAISAESAQIISPVSDWVAVLGILSVLIPCMMLIYVLMSLIASSRPKPKSLLIAFIVWVVVVLSTLSFAVKDDLPEKLFYGFELPEPSYNPDNLLNTEQTTFSDADLLSEQDTLQAK